MQKEDYSPNVGDRKAIRCPRCNMAFTGPRGHEVKLGGPLTEGHLIFGIVATVIGGLVWVERGLTVGMRLNEDVPSVLDFSGFFVGSALFGLGLYFTIGHLVPKWVITCRELQFFVGCVGAVALSLAGKYLLHTMILPAVGMAMNSYVVFMYVTPIVRQIRRTKQRA